MVFVKSVSFLAVASVRRAFVAMWVLPYLQRHLSSESLVDFKICVSEEIAQETPRWVARDNILIETWQMIRAVKQRRYTPLNFGDSYRTE